MIDGVGEQLTGVKTVSGTLKVILAFFFYQVRPQSPYHSGRGTQSTEFHGILCGLFFQGPPGLRGGSELLLPLTGKGVALRRSGPYGSTSPHPA